MSDEPCIMILEDDPEICNQLVSCCSKAGYNCLVFEILENAVYFLENNQLTFDLAIIDLTLLKSQGNLDLDFLEYIRNSHCVRSSLAITGRNDLQAGIQAMERGAQYYLQKPIAEPLFLSLVAILRKREGLRISEQEEQRIRDCDTWTLFHDFMGVNQEVMQTLIRTRGTRVQLQKVIDAMGVEVAVLDPEGKVVLVNQRLRDNRESFEIALNDKTLTSFMLWNQRVGQQTTTDDDLGSVSERVLDGKYYKLERHMIKDYFGGHDYTVVTATDTTFMKQIQTVLRHLSQIETEPFRAAAQSIVTLLHENGFPDIQFFRTRDGQTFQLIASTTISQKQIEAFPQPYELKDTDPLIAEALRTRKPVKRHRSEAGNVIRPEPLNGADVLWFVKTILQTDNRSNALLCIEFGLNDSAPTSEQMLMLEAITPVLADVVSIIVRREEEEKRRTLHEFVHTIYARLTTFEKESQVLDCIVEELSNQLKASSSYILLETQECSPGELIIVHIYQKPPYDLSSYRARSDIGLNRIAFHDKTVQIETDYWKNPRAAEYIRYIREQHPSALKAIEDLRSLVILPILQGELCIGLLELTFDSHQHFEPWIKMELQSLADLVGLILANIKKMKRLEDEVRRKTTLEDMAMLGAGIMHTVKNDLSAAKIAMENLRDEPTQVSISRRVPMALRRIDHGFRIAETFSDLARPHSTESEHFNLCRVVAEITDLMQSEMAEHNIYYRQIAAEKIHHVYGPVEALRIAFFDLFTNAIRSMVDGGTLTAHFRNDHVAKQVILDISDTGEGMTEKQVQQLFKFGPGDPIPAGGIGLGLYLAHRVITVALGTITAESVERHGTTITIRLPME
jgi:signal transduction histidine kinase/DNA-binding response OmpR family regulator